MLFYFPPKKKLSKQIAPDPKSWPTKNSTSFIISLTVPPSNQQQKQQFCPKPIIISASSPSPTHHRNAEAMNTRTPFLNNCSSVTAPHGRFKKQWQCQARGVNWGLEVGGWYLQIHVGFVESGDFLHKLGFLWDENHDKNQPFQKNQSEFLHGSLFPFASKIRKSCRIWTFEPPTLERRYEGIGRGGPGSGCKRWSCRGCFGRFLNGLK